MKTMAFHSILQRAQGGLLVAALLLAWDLATGSASAQTFWVADGVGNWNVASSWSAGIPTAATDAQINNGGTVRLFDPGARAKDVTVGFNPGNSGTLEVLGEAQFTDVNVGVTGLGTLKIINGGKVASTDAKVDGIEGQGTVDGAGSTWTTFIMYVGYNSSGTLTIQNGGAVSAGGYIGYQAGSRGTTTVDGANSTWTSNFGLVVGGDGDGVLHIQNGGTVSTKSGLINYQVALAGSGSGLVTVDGANSKWTNAGAVDVGQDGAATLSITRGGRVSSTGGTIGNAVTANGTATVDGTGSTWDNSGDLAVGYFGAGTLSITGGGKVSNSNANIGAGSGSSGMVTVDGAGSVWTNSSVLAVGSAGAGELNITGGGVVSSTIGRIARSAGSSGAVLIDGPGSIWNCSNVFTMGLSGTGTSTLTVQNGGELSMAGGMTIGFLGTVRGDGTIIANVANEGVVAPGPSTGTLHVTGNFDHFLSATLQIEMASPGSFDKLAVTGNINLGGAFFGGALQVSLIDGYVPHGSQSFDILDWGGTLGGSFDSIQLPTLGGTLVWDTSQLYINGILSVTGPPALAGDYNANGTVDAADNVVWRNTLGQAGAGLAADGDGDSDVDNDDYAMWRANFGATAGPGATGSAGAAAVPEPATLLLSIAGASLLFAAKRGDRLGHD